MKAKLRKSQRSTRRYLHFENNRKRRIADARIDRDWARRMKQLGLDHVDSGRYILRGKEPVRCPRLTKWGQWFEKERIPIGRDQVGEARVSTIFLGLDHGWMEDGKPPVLFETMIFGGEHDDEQYRYTTWDEARAAHVHLVEQLRSNHE
jgi:hypothetical protein